MPLSKTPVESLRHWLHSGSPPPLSTEVIDSARTQGLSGLLWTLTTDATDPRLRDALRCDSLRVLADGVRKLEAAERTLASLATAGLRALPLKGAALAELVYSSAAERPMVDVDLLALDSFEESCRVLERTGLEPAGRADHASAFRDPLSDTIVELHSSFTSCPGFFPVDSDGLWRRSQVREGQVSRIPSLEDLLLQMALHASFQHGLVLSLVQWLDFRRVLEMGTLRTDHVLERAREARAEGALAAALHAAAAVLGAPIPSDLGGALDPSLPTCVRRWLDAPLALVSPGVPRVARLRWELARGRRWELVRGTIAGGEERTSWARLARTGTLLRRFGPAFFS